MSATAREVIPQNRTVAINRASLCATWIIPPGTARAIEASQPTGKAASASPSQQSRRVLREPKFLEAHADLVADRVRGVPAGVAPGPTARARLAYREHVSDCSGRCPAVHRPRQRGSQPSQPTGLCL